MKTEYIYKILLIYPESEVEGVNAFAKEFLDPTGEDWVKLILSADGKEPATHGWTAFHATKEDANIWLERFAERLGGAVPPGLTDWPRDAQRQWMAGAQAALWQADGIYFESVFNDEGETPDTEAALIYAGLKRIISIN